MINDFIEINSYYPSDPLARYVRKFSVFKCDRDDLRATQKLTPSPYTYVSYNHYKPPKSIINGKTYAPRERLMIAGIKTEKNYVRYNGKLSQILAEFTGTGFYRLFGLSPALFLNDLRELKAFEKPEAYYKLCRSLTLSQSEIERVNIFIEYFSSKISGALPKIDYAEKSLRLIEENRGLLQISELAEKVNICERQLNRKFLEVAGLSPKKFSELVQLHYLISLFNQKKYNAEDIVFKANFFDRPHLTRQFKKLTGMTPFEFIRSDKHIAFKYFNDTSNI